MRYPIYFAKQDNQLKINVPDIAGCEANCETIDQGYAKAQNLIEDHLRILAEYGEAIPQAKTIDYYQASINEVIWALVDIDITPFLGKSHKINVTLPELLIKQIDDRVSKSERYKTRSGFIAMACINELEQHKS